mmetsp:Transcript_47182/g.109925  ORF Transcript_47182/g.109925 Transcript_47182/m.109925 type:complete len:229 (+) Transcript_47182:1598-2284(+)
MNLVDRLHSPLRRRLYLCIQSECHGCRSCGQLWCFRPCGNHRERHSAARLVFLQQGSIVRRGCGCRRCRCCRLLPLLVRRMVRNFWVRWTAGSLSILKALRWDIARRCTGHVLVIIHQHLPEVGRFQPLHDVLGGGSTNRLLVSKVNTLRDSIAQLIERPSLQVLPFVQVHILDTCTLQQKDDQVLGIASKLVQSLKHVNHGVARTTGARLSPLHVRTATSGPHALRL